MIPFSVQVKFFRLKQYVLKWYIKTVPFPIPILFSGPGSSLDLCSAIAQMGSKRILIVTDTVLVKLGILNGMKETLENNGVEYVVYDGVEPDPSYGQIEAALAVLKQNHCDAILAVGGGSPIDAAKVVSALATNDKPIDKLAGMFKVRKACLPLYVIPTTAGSGSEATIAAIITNPETQNKRTVIDPRLVPVATALDGALLTGLPPAITVATGMDVLTHAVEAYISSNALPYTDRLALAAIRLFAENFEETVKNGQNLEARQNMILASFYAGIAFTKAGVGYVHTISHEFGGRYHAIHGVANSMILPHILEYSKHTVPDRLAHLAEACGLNKKAEHSDQLAQNFIDYIRFLMKEFDIPDKLEALKSEDIPAIAKAALKEAHSSYAVPRYMDQPTCEKLISKMLV